MGKVSLEINGRRYALGCDNGEEERLENLGRKLDERIKQLANQFGQIGDLQLLVMAGIGMTDELEEVSESVEEQASALSVEMQRKGEKAIADASKLENSASDALVNAARQIEKLAEKLSRH